MIKVKTHKRVGKNKVSVVRTHARTVKKGKKWVSDSTEAEKVKKVGGRFEDGGRSANIHNRINNRVDSYDSSLKTQLKKASQRPQPKTGQKRLKKFAYNAPDLFSKASLQGSGNKSKRRLGITVKESRKLPMKTSKPRGLKAMFKKKK